VLKFIAFGLWTVMVINFAHDPDGTKEGIHSTFDLGGSLVQEATSGIANATGSVGGAARGSGLSAPDGWQVVTLPDGRQVAVPPGYQVQP
jgi:hypothetical protein